MEDVHIVTHPQAEMLYAVASLTCPQNFFLLLPLVLQVANAEMLIFFLEEPISVGRELMIGIC